MEIINYNLFKESSEYKKYSNDVRVNMYHLGFGQILGEYLETKNNKCIEKTLDVVNDIMKIRLENGLAENNSKIVYRRFSHLGIPYLEIFYKGEN